MERDPAQTTSVGSHHAETGRFDPTESQGWHGWGTDAWSLHIGPLPGRKSVCLYYRSGCIIDSLAFFRDWESAFRALAIIDRLVAGTWAGTATQIDGHREQPPGARGGAPLGIDGDVR